MARRQIGFTFHNVEIFKGEDNCLGIGSYGAVYKAKCDELPCAAKILHPILFQSNDPGAVKIMQRFEQECEFMKGISHPNIVQFLGVCQDPDSGLPALLMELLDESLTKFLEKSKDLLSFHVQLDFCHDIAIALCYLHSNGIIHRDLSSNNVLLIAGRRAKVSDFGMSKLIEAGGQTRTRQSATYCPGTEVYMPPEALKDNPVLSAKHDCFSFGPLVVQILTRLFPNPGSRKKEIPHPASPTGFIEIPVLETERRNEHIKLIDSSHPLLPIAIDCLNYNHDDRPTSQVICHRLAALKKSPAYSESHKEQSQHNKATLNEDESMSVKKQSVLEQQQSDDLAKQNQVLRDKLNEVDQKLDAKEKELSEQIQAKDQEIHSLQEECIGLRRSLESTARNLRGNEHLLEQRLRDLNRQVYDRQRSVTQLEKAVNEKDTTLEKLREQLFFYQSSSPEPRHKALNLSDTDGSRGSRASSVEKSVPITFICENEGRAVQKMARGSTAVDSESVYIRSVGCKDVYSFAVNSKTWDKLPVCPLDGFTLVSINNTLTAIGVDESDEQSNNSLISFMSSAGSRGGRKKWSKCYPSMNTRRFNPTAVSTDEILIVAGGTTASGERVSTVEVMDIEHRQWFHSTDLPMALSQASAVVCGDDVYLIGGVDNHKKWTNTVLTCSLNDLQKVFSSKKKRAIKIRIKRRRKTSTSSFWHEVADVSVARSTCICLEGHLLVIGGVDAKGTVTNSIQVYNPDSDTWEVVGHLGMGRSQCLVVPVPTQPSNRALVFGGWTEQNMTDSVEILSLEC